MPDQVGQKRRYPQEIRKESGQEAYKSKMAQRTYELERGEAAAQEASAGETAP